MTTKGMKTGAIGTWVLMGVLTAGCSTQAKRVECDWRLKPINPPAQVTVAPVSSAKETVAPQ